MGRAGSSLALETADAVIVRDELATVLAWWPSPAGLAAWSCRTWSVGQRAVVGHSGPKPRPHHLGVGFRHQRAEAYGDTTRPAVGPARLNGGVQPAAPAAVQHPREATGGDHHPLRALPDRTAQGVHHPPPRGGTA
ncbi:hypothetical protein [Streptomyces incarnatus]|uniref:hypothetical protein n=1 Tax=Streptomyces incarnatus TaxID=665007 RepID=UPI001AD835FB|nr:hypothetical protein [Streptomyces incarnatus]